jgi:hypothetical protein
LFRGFNRGGRAGDWPDGLGGSIRCIGWAVGRRFEERQLKLQSVATGIAPAHIETGQPARGARKPLRLNRRSGAAA